jgi:hypothetical protein
MQPAPKPPIDPRAEEWAERNPWFGQDGQKTSTAWGVHRQLIDVEKFDVNTEEYYDELDRRLATIFKAVDNTTGYEERQAPATPRAQRPVQAVAPATRSSGVNSSARRAVRLSPSQVAIARKLGVPLEEYAKYVKE